MSKFAEKINAFKELCEKPEHRDGGNRMIQLNEGSMSGRIWFEMFEPQSEKARFSN